MAAYTKQVDDDVNPSPNSVGRPDTAFLITQFNRTVEWDSILEPMGYKPDGSEGGNQFWKRNGKKELCVSAEDNYELSVLIPDHDVFELGKRYSKFDALRLGVHGGDAKAGDRDLLGAFGHDQWEEPIPLQEEALPTFPLEVLPEWLGRFCRALGASLEMAVDLPGMQGLGTLSAGCGGRVKVRVNEDWSEPTNIWSITAMPPGEKKTACVNAMKKPLEHWQEAHQLSPGEYETAKMIRESLEATIKEMKKDYGKADAAEKAKIRDQIKAAHKELDANPLPRVPKRLTR